MHPDIPRESQNLIGDPDATAPPNPIPIPSPIRTSRRSSSSKSVISQQRWGWRRLCERWDGAESGRAWRPGVWAGGRLGFRRNRRRWEWGCVGKKRSFGRGKRLERGWDWWGGESVVLGCVGLGFGVEGGCCVAMGVWGVRNKLFVSRESWGNGRFLIFYYNFFWGNNFFFLWE